MYCNECGKQNPDYAKFCAFCGTRLLGPGESAPEQPVEPSLAPDDPVFGDPVPVDPIPKEAAPARQEPASKPIKLKPDVIKLDPHQVYKRPNDGTTVRPLELNPAQPRHSARVSAPVAGSASAPVDMDDDAERVQSDAPDTKAGRVSERTGRVPIGAVTASGSRMEPPARPANVKKDGARGRLSHREPAPSPFRQAQQRRAMNISRPEDDLFFEDIDVEDEYEEEEESGLARRFKGAIAVAFVLCVVLMVGWLFMTPGGEVFRAGLGMNAPAAAFKRLGDEALEKGQLQRASNAYHQALKRDGENYDYALLVAQTAAASGDAETAARAYQLCMQLKPNSPEPYQQLAELLEQRGNDEVAEQWRRQGYSVTGDAELIASLATPVPTATPEPTRDVPNFSDIQDFMPVD